MTINNYLRPDSPGGPDFHPILGAAADRSFGEALIDWLNRAAPREDLACLPDVLGRVADVLESRGANLGLEPGRQGVSITDAIVLAGVQTHRFAQALLAAACDAIETAADSAPAIRDMDTTAIVAAIRAHPMNDTRPIPSVHVCPSCSVDGGYGTAVAGADYLCPECRINWSPNPGGEVATTWLSNQWQIVKVWWGRCRWL
jgi:hypothetical protein